MSSREQFFAATTKVLARCLLPVAFLRAPGHARYFAAQWALSLRFPHENLRGLTNDTYLAFTAARSEALWRDGQLLGLTSGHRDPVEQHRLYCEEIMRTGSSALARERVLPPEESSHVQGIALDVRPREGARWLEANGARYGLYRTYDNEWWHFEFRTYAPTRIPNPSLVTIMRTERMSLRQGAYAARSGRLRTGT
ncbi:M15 family metallopeptidase [Actinocrispum sp. NPDC049592]|uniref:M15 family metallopeptidase n=1 Tax=Actinocrispum sp. NPDC049592 TaxID=3154835 RepID=UPI00343A5194